MRESRENRVIRLKLEAEQLFIARKLNEERKSHIERAIHNLDALYDNYAEMEDHDPNFKKDIAIEIWRYGYDLRKLRKDILPNQDVENEK